MGIIAKREGTARTPAAYILRFAETLRMGGSQREPPPDAGVVPPRNQGGSQREPLNHENRPLFEMELRVQSIDSSALSITSSIDRSSDPPQNEEHADELRQLLTAVVRHTSRAPDQHPPDKTMLRMFAHTATWPTLQSWLTALLKFNSIEMPRAVASPYAWLLAVLLQKLHGIAPADQKPTLQLLRGGKQLRTRICDARDEDAARAKATQKWYDDNEPAAPPAEPEPWPDRRADYLRETGRAEQLAAEQPPPGPPQLTAEEENEMQKFRDHMARQAFAVARKKGGSR
jgi:hypothetical protein